MFPIFFVINKLQKRKDLNAFDLFLCFQTLYLVIIPLTGDVKDIMYTVVRNDFSTQFGTFLQINLFLYSILLIDVYYTKHKKRKSLLDITLRIKEWGNKYVLNDNIYLLVFLIIIICIGDLLSSYMAGNNVMTIQESRDLAKMNNTTRNLMFDGIIAFLRPFLAFILTSIAIQKKRPLKSVLFVLSVIASGIVLMLGSRTWLFEFLAMTFLVYYSHHKNHLTNKIIIRWGIILVSVLVLLFPVISAIKFGKVVVGRQMLTDSNPIEVLSATIDYVTKNNDNIESFDNKNQRKWNVYQIIGLSVSSEYQGNGELTLKSLSYQMPRFIFPDKDMEGSQIAIEKGLKVYNDVADSILLFGITENRYIGFIISTMAVLMIFLSYNFIYLFLNNKQRSPFVYPFILSSFFIVLDQPEWSVDRFFTSIIYVVGGCIIIITLSKVMPAKRLRFCR